MAEKPQPPVMNYARSQATVLFSAMPELWIVFAIKILAITAYSLMNTTFVLWLSHDLGFSDEKAGFWVGIWTALMTFFTVLIGSLTDAIGLRKTFLLGVCVWIAARTVLTFSMTTWVVLAFGMLPLALGEALGTPVMVAAIRRYSTTPQRSIAFSVFYAMMNVGFLIAAFLFDTLRGYMGEHGQFTLPLVGLQFSTYRTLFFVSLLFQLLVWPIVYFGLRAGAEATDEGVKITPEVNKYPHEILLKALLLTTRDALKDTVRIFGGLWRQPGFYRFLAFLTLAAFVRLIFIQMHYTYPKFGIRELGEGAPIGKLWGLNSALIIVLVPIVGALTQRITAYKMVTWGSAMTAASVFVMVLPTAWFENMANQPPITWFAQVYLGLTGHINPWYAMILIYVVALSIGEAFYSPRLYEYAAVIAPKGQEASYMALSYLPFFFAKVLVSTSSGLLLARFCPETGPDNSGTMWLIIGLTTAIAPIGLITLRRYIRAPEAGRGE